MGKPEQVFCSFGLHGSLRNADFPVLCFYQVVSLRQADMSFPYVNIQYIFAHIYAMHSVAQEVIYLICIVSIPANRVFQPQVGMAEFK